MKKRLKTKEISARQIFSNIIFCLKFLYKLNKKMFYIRLSATIIECAANFIPIIFIRLIINEITVGKNITLAFIYVIGMVTVSFINNRLSAFLAKKDGLEFEVTTYKIKLFLANLTMKMKYSDLEDPRMKDFISLASSSNPFYEIFTYSFGFFGAFVNSAGLTAIIFTINPIIFVLILGVVAVQMVRDKKWRNFSYGWRHSKANLNRRTSYLANLGNDTRFGKEVRVNNLENWVLGKVDKHYQDEFFPAQMELLKKSMKFNSFPMISYIIQQGVIYLYLGYEVVFNGMLLGDFSMYMTSIEKFSDFIGGFIGNYALLISNGLTAQEIRHCITFSEKQDENADINAMMNFNKSDFVLEFRDVSFKYPNTDRIILENISLILRAGETLSLVGINGAGKSTFVKLLCRFYDPTSGEILLNGIPVNKIPYSEYIELFGVVFQDFKLFSFSVRDNIALSFGIDEDKLNKSIDESGLRNKVDSLPKGTETLMNKQFDSEGVEFSGGEGQKVAIARAIYKNAPILILDEPTSALDPIAEYEVYKRFSQMADGKCSIYISHRLSSTRFTDKVAVFSGGNLAEYGNHADLIKIRDGIYKNMFDMQAQYYQN